MKLNHHRKVSIGFAGLLAAVSLCITPVLTAQSGQPARAVRLSYVDGKVQLSQGGQLLADQAVINAPLFEGTQISTGDDGKAEIQFEDGSVARLSPTSSLTLKTLNNGQSEMVLDHGLAYFELQTGGQNGPISVDFADSVVTASGFTILRVNMDNPPGAVALFSGNAHVERAMGGSIDLHGGESAEFNGTNPANPNIAEAIQPDSWDAWNSDRDQVLNTEASTQSTATGNVAGSNASNPAWSTLDANGNWYNVPGQGYIWSPYDASSPSFDPYGNGAWMNTPGYGYVWASGYSWGYMPYQCGMWNFYDSFGWGWAPGSGGCNPWWGAGFYGGPRFGILPIGYQPIRFPGRGRYPTPGRIIIVNRTSFRASTALPARTRNSPVVIAGQTVQPLRPVPSRTAFQRPVTATTTRVAPTAGMQAGVRSGYVSSRPAYTAPPPGAFNRGSSAANYNSPIQRNNGSAPVQRYSSAPTYSAPRPAASAPPPHYSPPPSPPSGGGGGGGGGGGAHPGGGHH